MAILPVLIVHGGAGRYTDDRIGAARRGCERAVRAGLQVLADGGSALDASQAAVVVLEDDPTFNAGVGSVGVLLQMTGHERDVAVGFATAVAVNLAVNLALIPVWGVDGATLGAAANMILWNTLLAFRVYQKLGIRPTALG